MKKTFFYLCALVVIASCSGSQNKTTPADDSASTEVAGNSVDYKIAEKYFIKNDVTTVPSSVKDQAAFDSYFGAASVMGENGTPTKIDFSKEYVIVVSHDPTNKQIEIKPLALSQGGGNITLDYTETEGEEQSFTQRPLLMLIVDKKYDGNVLLNKK